MDPEQAAIKRAEWAGMQARKDYWDAKREKRRQAKLAKRERECEEYEPCRLLRGGR